MADVKKIVDNPHPIYKNYVDNWNFYLESYEGGVDYTQSDITNRTIDTQAEFRILAGGTALRLKNQSHLFQHKKERRKDYLARVRMSYYYNFCSPIIDIYTSHLFKESIKTEFENIQVVMDNRQNDIDRRGSSVHEFRRDMAKFVQMYGHVFVLVDSPKSFSEVTSLKQRMDAGLFPFAMFFRPQDVINWSLDRFGKPYWVLVCEKEDGNVMSDSFNPDENVVVKFRLWTKTDWRLYDAEFNLVDEGVHGLGMVPIVCVFNKPSNKARNFLGISELADIAFINRDIYNLTSELQEITRNQTFAFLAIQGKSDDYNEGAVGTNQGLIYPEGMNQPVYVSPPSENAKTIMAQINNQVSKIFRLAKLEGASAEFKEQSSEMKSGVAKAWDFNETNSTLSQKAEYLEDGELKIWNIFAKWEGMKEFEGSVDYPDEFSVQSLSDDLEEAERSLKIQLGKTYYVEQKKAIIQKKYPRLPQDKLEEMFAEIEVNTTDGNVGNNNGRLRDRLSQSLFNRNPIGQTQGENDGRRNGS